MIFWRTLQQTMNNKCTSPTWNDSYGYLNLDVYKFIYLKWNWGGSIASLNSPYRTLYTIYVQHPKHIQFNKWFLLWCVAHGPWHECGCRGCSLEWERHCWLEGNLMCMASKWNIFGYYLMLNMFEKSRNSPESRLLYCFAYGIYKCEIDDRIIPQNVCVCWMAVC